MSKSSIGLRKAGISSLATAALVAGACVAGAGAANATTGFNFHRINGSDRYATSSLVAKEFGQASDVILASGLSGHYPDALAANYLAGIKNAPVLLTKKDSTPPAVLQAIKDSGAQNVWIVGGTGVISQAQEDALTGAGYNVRRIAGDNRFETATKVIDEGGQSSGEGIVATGMNFPDALGAGPLSYAKDMPLAISKRYSISQDEIDALKAAGVTKVLIVGGTTAVSNAVAAQLESNNITVEKRLFGSDRAGTAEAVAEYELNHGFTNTAVNVASGYAQGDGADALGGGALSGANKTPMLITNSDVHPGAATLAYLTDNANTLEKGDLFGGPNAITEDAQNQMEAAAQAVSSNQSYTVNGGKSTLTVSNNGDNAGVQQYTVTGLGSDPVDIVLADPSNVKTDANGQTTFTVAKGATTATLGTGVGQITVVNGVGNSGKTAYGVTPVNGQITFTIDSSTPGDTIPVVFSRADKNDTLSVDSNGAPTEPFGVGTATTYLPEEATAGSPSADAPITSVDKGANYFVAGAPGSEAVYNYGKVGDTYYVGDANADATAQYQVTEADFEAALSKGDTLSANSSYNPNFGSVFVLEDLSPAKPATASATAQSDTSIKVSWTQPSTGAPDSYNIYRATGTSAPTKLSGYSKVGSVAGDASDLSYTDTGLSANTTYYYAVTAVQDGDESSTYATASDTTLPAGATSALESTNAIVTTDATFQNEVSGGDTYQIVFNHPVTVANGAAIRIKDNDGEQATLTNGGNAVFTTNQATYSQGSNTYKAGQVLTVVVSGTSDVPPMSTVTGGNGVVNYPADISNESGITSVVNGTTVSWVPANSSDHTLNVDTNSSDAASTVPPKMTSAAADSTAQTVTITYDEPVAGQGGSVDPAQFGYTDSNNTTAAVPTTAVANADGTVTLTFAASTIQSGATGAAVTYTDGDATLTTGDVVNADGTQAVSPDTTAATVK